MCVCVVVVALNRLGEKLQDFFQRGDERVHVLFGVVDVETGASAAENVQVSQQQLPCSGGRFDSRRRGAGRAKCKCPNN